MAAATTDRDISRQPSDLVNYNGASGRVYYQGTMVVSDTSNVIRPATSFGVSGDVVSFLGVVAERVDLSGNLGNSNFTLKLWKTGEFTFAAQGTGVSAHIGQRAFIIDDQTVGVSAAIPRLVAGEIVAIPTSSTYRVRITNYTGTLAANA